MALNNSYWFQDTGLYNSVATQSLRFDDGSSADLTKTFGSGNQKTWTWSCWVKRSALGGSKMLLSNYTSGTDVAWIYFNSSNQFYFQNYEGGTQLELKTNALYRDVSAWYHVVVALDTTQATSSNRAKIYINGEQITSFATSTYPSQNADLKINTNSESHKIGSADSQYYFDGYMAEVNFVDGTQLAPTSFGETKNGAWIPIEYTGSYGTNGFRLQFNQTGVGTGSSSTIGADTSGNANHFSSSGIVASDCDMPDSPENNFATWNGLTQGASTLSDGNLKSATFWTADLSGYASTFMIESGKWYWELRIDGASVYPYIGITSQEQIGSSANGGAFYNIAWRPDGTSVSDGSSLGTITKENISTFTDGDIISFALDIDARKLWVAKNNTWQDSGDPSAGTGENASWTIDVGISASLMGYQSQGVGTVANFGQDDTFVGGISSTGNTDENGIGVFKYAPPTGFISLCSANLPEPTISPNETTQADDYFNTSIWTGNSTNNRTITNLGFQPDWVWIKRRDGADNHFLQDSIRGADKQLFSNLSDAEFNNTNQVKSFDSDGFTLGTDGGVNFTGRTYVAWNWKAGGTAVSNTDGSITSSVSANTDAGFSIVNYTGTGSSATVGHGLGKKPSLIFIKRRAESSNWAVAGSVLGSTATLYLNLTNAQETYADPVIINTQTTTTFSIGTDTNRNKNTFEHIAYCFAEIEGYSKIGSYTGNGSTDGTFVYTGFRPAFILFKNATTTATNWQMNDSTRDTFNVVNKRLAPSTSDAESSSTYQFGDFLSNGFKIRETDDTWNKSGATYIYMAFAENPFKYANAR